MTRLDQWAQECLRYFVITETLARRVQGMDRVQHYAKTRDHWRAAWYQALIAESHQRPQSWSAAGEIVT